ncbi:class I SAM-dependent methyltransferase [Mucilaginibacter sp. KACC 22773]|uniref:class I SAM-dependent methyltransferase n=1 Tax=Mucilaginibacter sp. KACC 22773 TaxID=3025671 RepID=UPI0023672059|nr:class I SAM-dependent methyltransferase [Mucilaginibacter sp. KACC 22773]WDF79575.1 class I SAM-dependent methyltransferase [Mucilaginibacter sp. KACC 22773]
METPIFTPVFKNFYPSKNKRMLNELLNPSLFYHDSAFDELYPEHIRKLSQMHWTPVEIAKIAGNFLAIPNTRVLDIGSGVGKFCITAGFFHPETTFSGIEQRRELYNFAEAAKAGIDLPNVTFTHGNLTELEFNNYDHFYFYNPFYENIEPDSRIDYAVETSFELYDQYSRLVYQMLAEKPSKTRLVTFHTPGGQVPPGYQLVNNSYSRLLKMWIKE